MRGGRQGLRLMRYWPVVLALLILSFLVFHHAPRSLQAAAPGMWSVWLEPPPGPLRDQLGKLVEDLGEEFGNPRFAPHVTLQGGIDGEEADVVEKTRQLATELGQYTLRFSDLAVGEIFHQYVFILMAKDGPVMEANKRAREIFGMEPAPYMPHLSLAYSADEARKGELYARAKELLYGAGAGYDTLLADSGFAPATLSVWKTAADDRSLQSWVKVADVPLPAGREG